MVAFTRLTTPARRTHNRTTRLAECAGPSVKAKRPTVRYKRVDQSFAHGVSADNGQYILDQLASSRKCDCLPYFDVFTYGRWKALWMAPRKGEHGIRIPTVIRAGEQKYATVFCRCQVVEVA
jgi:hypothetical protein